MQCQAALKLRSLQLACLINHDSTILHDNSAPKSDWLELCPCHPTLTMMLIFSFRETPVSGQDNYESGALQMGAWFPGFSSVPPLPITVSWPTLITQVIKVEKGKRHSVDQVSSGPSVTMILVFLRSFSIDSEPRNAAGQNRKFIISCQHGEARLRCSCMATCSCSRTASMDRLVREIQPPCQSHVSTKWFVQPELCSTAHELHGPRVVKLQSRWGKKQATSPVS